MHRVAARRLHLEGCAAARTAHEPPLLRRVLWRAGLAGPALKPRPAPPNKWLPSRNIKKDEWRHRQHCRPPWIIPFLPHTLASDIHPSDEQLKVEIDELHAVNPEAGVKSLRKLLAKKHPLWQVSETRVRKAFKGTRKAESAQAQAEAVTDFSFSEVSKVLFTKFVFRNQHCACRRRAFHLAPPESDLLLQSVFFLI